VDQNLGIKCPWMTGVLDNWGLYGMQFPEGEEWPLRIPSLGREKMSVAYSVKDGWQSPITLDSLDIQSHVQPQAWVRSWSFLGILDRLFCYCDKYLRE
jgi:hypothetical protein